MRREGWESILAAEIDKARALAFDWQAHNCALWAADVVLALTGMDHARPYRGKIKSELSAARLLKKTPLAARVPLPRKPVAFAQRGDVALYAGALGICIGQHAAFLGQEGLRFVPVLDCDMAWEVA